MKRRWVSLLTALALAVGVCVAEPLSGAAASAPLEANEDGSVKGSCSLTIYAEDPNKEDGFGEDLAKADVVVDLYLIARAVKTEKYDTYYFKAVSGYGELKIPGENDLNWKAEDWEALAQKAAAVALDETSPDEAEVNGQTVETKISNLDAGLYLLVARGKDLTELSDYKVELPQTDPETDDEAKKIATIANSERYTYYFSPQLVSLPSKEQDENGVINTANPGNWLFDLAVNLKREQQRRYGSLEIIKTLTEFETVEGTGESATFVFKVEGTLDDEVYSEVESITFTAAGQQSVELKGIPAGMTVTVTEVYSGSSYELTVEGDRTAKITADEVAQVDFENKYNKRRTNGHGIKNQFVYDAEKEKWNWTPDPGQDTTGDVVESQTEE